MDFPHLGDKEGYEHQEEPGVGPSLMLGRQASEDNVSCKQVKTLRGQGSSWVAAPSTTVSRACHGAGPSCTIWRSIVTVTRRSRHDAEQG